MHAKSKLLDQVRTVLRLKHLSFRTEEAYVGWIRRFILFHDKRLLATREHPRFETFCRTWPFTITLPPRRRMSP